MSATPEINMNAAQLDSGQSSSYEEKTIKSLFEDAMKLVEAIEEDKEPVNSTSVQTSIQIAMDKLQEVTKLVSAVGMFSSNESAEELPTDHLQYLLLPALLGSLSLKVCNRPRREVIELAEIYFKDYLQRCKDYGITDVEIPQDASSDVGIAIRNQSEQNKIAAMVHSRESKIRRYQQMKELKEKLGRMKKAMCSPNVDDETKREYFITLLLDYINQSLEELNCIEQEKPILEYMAKRSGETKPYIPENRAKDPPKPLKPFIITKDAVQKAVYGLGYPSLPTMTVEEFYDKRVQEGIFPSASNIPHATIENADKEGVDDEAIRKEALIDAEDPEELQRQRDMDEFKDEHRRGSGNRYNRS